MEVQIENLNFIRTYSRNNQAMPGRRRAVLHPKPPYLLYQTLHAVLYAELSYRTTVSHQSVLPDLQFRTRNSETTLSTILKSTKDVRRLFYACYPKLFRLNFQTGLQYDPACLSGIIYTLFPHYFSKENFQKKAIRLSFQLHCKFFTQFRNHF